MPIDDILSDLDALRADVSACISKARAIGDKIARGTGGREGLAITALQESGHWLRDATELLTPHAPDEAQHD